MLPFVITLLPGQSPYRQVVYAATKAILSGTMLPGDAFPSVRELSQALKINPNTAQKVVAELVRDGLLAVHPGVGTVVERVPEGGTEERRRLLSDGVDELVVEARRLGISRDDLHSAVDMRWAALFGNGATAASTHGSSTLSPQRGRR
jgi:GntR family transcriptional regulator